MKNDDHKQNRAARRHPHTVPHAKFSDLLALGFHMVGHWLLVDGKPDFELLNPKDPQKGHVFALVHNAELRYIGMTINTMKTRMGFIKTHTPDLLRDKIRDTLEVENNGRIEIYAIFLRELRDGFISDFQPSWNLMGVDSPDSDESL